MFFDPRIEVPMVRDLTEDEKVARLDRVGSVSALAEDEDASALGRQVQLFSDCGGDPHGT